LTHSGRLTHEVVTRQPWIRRRSGKVRQLQTDVLTTEPRRQPTDIVPPTHFFDPTFLFPLFTKEKVPLNPKLTTATYWLPKGERCFLRHIPRTYYPPSLNPLSPLRRWTVSPRINPPKQFSGRVSLPPSAKKSWTYYADILYPPNKFPRNFFPSIFPPTFREGGIPKTYLPDNSPRRFSLQPLAKGDTSSHRPT